MRILDATWALPEHYYSQDDLSAALKKHWADKLFNPERLEQLHRNVLVSGRHLALRLDEYEGLSFKGANDAYLRCAVDLGARALEDVLERSDLTPSEIDHLFFVSTTGIATPSIDARLVNRLALRPNVKRSPLFGLGCAGGAVGITRAADYLRAFPREIAVLLSVELCSLTLQREDLSIPNLIASGLFGDGAAAVVLVGADRMAAGPAVVASRSVFYPDTEHIMGWDVTDDGFGVVLSAEIPDLVRREMRRNVDDFLSAHRLGLESIETFVCHPGGPKVLEAFAAALDVPREALALTWQSLERFGNLSSVSVLVVLAETLRQRTPAPGSYGLLLAMGPGFATELVLLRW
ncbi:MAG TPA: 3-oxoacyl-[acyl-carrier-protein] synthase III C-terminal domain-containing protein [Vicinamibacteria bacterium]|nr:3-oxoacyl-[acyl-carrier-protein] synthase III C-terminal domain-containing protein [Vicinamibacteria bacterium]